jgi:hypothetical protein
MEPHTPAIHAEQLGSADFPAVLAALLPQEPELAYANFLPVAQRPGAAIELHRQRWEAGPGRIRAWVARAADGTPLAAVHADDRPFESAHFGFRAARLEPPIATADIALRAAALEVLYEAAVRELTADGWDHIAARASTRDRAAAWALQLQGLFHVDTQVSWMCPLTGTAHDEAPPPGLRIEVHDRTTLPAIAPQRWRELADFAAEAFDRGPFVFDLSVPYDRARAIYRVWTEKMMEGEWADAVLLAFAGDKAVAFISMLEMPDVSQAAGAKVCGRGLGATLPGYRGLFTAIQREMIARRPLDAAFMENETQVATIGSINVYARLGFRYLRSTATFHRRLRG